MRAIGLILILFLSTPALANQQQVSLAVWANEAIISTYTFNYKNFINRQKETAKYFTSKGWTSFFKALTASNLPEKIKDNRYFVSAVATLPPEIKQLDANHWQATMPILVLYQNPKYRQKQSLEVVIQFTTAPSGQGVRGLAITSLRSKKTAQPCDCTLIKEANHNTN